MLLHRARVVTSRIVPRRLRPRVGAAVFAVVALALRGDGVTCSCCGGRFRRFLSYPSLYCAGCGAYERHRQLALLLDEHPDLVAGADVLHVGPERCVIARYRARSGSWLAIDLDHPLADRQMDVQVLELPSASFDTALCAHVLDAVPDPARALGELHRVLRPGGRLILHAPPWQDLTAASDVGFTVEAVVLDEQRDPAARRRLGLDTLPVYLCSR